MLKALNERLVMIHINSVQICKNTFPMCTIKIVERKKHAINEDNCDINTRCCLHANVLFVFTSLLDLLELDDRQSTYWCM